MRRALRENTFLSSLREWESAHGENE